MRIITFFVETVIINYPFFKMWWINHERVIFFSFFYRKIGSLKLIQSLGYITRDFVLYSVGLDDNIP